MSDIEWSDFNDGNNSSGAIGEPKVASIEKIHPDYDLYRVIVLGCIFGELSNTLEAAKLKAESLLAEWDKKRGMIVSPVLCEKCGDSGLFRMIVDGKLHRKCDCTENPNAWVNVKQTIGGKG